MLGALRVPFVLQKNSLLYPGRRAGDAGAGACAFALAVAVAFTLTFTVALAVARRFWMISENFDFFQKADRKHAAFPS